MIDAHCHVASGDAAVVEFLIGRDFLGVHPWATFAADFDLAAAITQLRMGLATNTQVGVGEIGLDRLKVRKISPLMRILFNQQLALAAEFGRPVVLHGAKCWGEVCKAVAEYAGKIPAFLFHGFSRSGGLLPEIVRLNGYVSVGPAILNDHAVNYRALVKALPIDRLLVETDRDVSGEGPTIGEVVKALSGVLAMPVAELEMMLDANARRFFVRRKGG